MNGYIVCPCPMARHLIINLLFSCFLVMNWFGMFWDCIIFCISSQVLFTLGLTVPASQGSVATESKESSSSSSSNSSSRGFNCGDTLVGQYYTSVVAGTGVEASSPGDCRAVCRAGLTCTAWAWFSSTSDSRPLRCFTGSPGGSSGANTGAVSGEKYCKSSSLLSWTIFTTQQASALTRRKTGGFPTPRPTRNMRTSGHISADCSAGELPSVRPGLAGEGHSVSSSGNRQANRRQQTGVWELKLAEVSFIFKSTLNCTVFLPSDCKKSVLHHNTRNNVVDPDDVILKIFQDETEIYKGRIF